MIKPFQIVWELIEFAIQAVFVYVLAILLIIGILIIAISENTKKEKIKQIYIITEKVDTKEKEKEIVKQKECTRIDGCRVDLKDGSVEW